MFSVRNRIIEFIKNGNITEDKIPTALMAAKVTPDVGSWQLFIDRLLLWLGGLALAFAVMFFIAFNWTEFGRFAKFGMVEILIALVVAAFCLIGEDRIGGKVLLLMASILLGVLLALYGQTYQTGADPWQLFFYWALLMMPWAAVARFAAIWIVWVALMNLSIVLYYNTFTFPLWFLDSEMFIIWVVFGLNSIILAIWEILSTKFIWLRERWATRLLAVCSGSTLTAVVLNSIFSSESFLVAFVVWLVWLLSMYMMYRKLRPDLFVLAGLCVSAIAIAIPFLATVLLQDFNPGGFMVLGMIIIGMGTGAAFWLKKVHREIQS
jgi:uncharacterized membrane protein